MQCNCSLFQERSSSRRGKIKCNNRVPSREQEQVAMAVNGSPESCLMAPIDEKGS